MSTLSLQQLADALGVETARLGLELSAEQLARSAVHVSAMLEWNCHTNLTRIVEPAEIARRHVVESILAARLIPSAPAPKVVDVGSGAGFPGLALRLTRPEIVLTLIEPRTRKAAFLRHVAFLEPQPRPRIIERRVEEVDLADQDVVTVRGFLLDPSLAARMLRPGGRLITFVTRGDEQSASLEAALWSCAEELQLPQSRGSIRAWIRDSR